MGDDTGTPNGSAFIIVGTGELPLLMPPPPILGRRVRAVVDWDFANRTSASDGAAGGAVFDIDAILSLD